MVEYGCLTFVIMAFLIACDYQFGSKYGAEWTYRTIIPKDSFWRKIYPFKEKETKPLRYAKLIPFFITFVILMVALIGGGIALLVILIVIILVVKKSKKKKQNLNSGVANSEPQVMPNDSADTIETVEEPVVEPTNTWSTQPEVKPVTQPSVSAQPSMSQPQPSVSAQPSMSQPQPSVSTQPSMSQPQPNVSTQSSMSQPQAPRTFLNQQSSTQQPTITSVDDLLKSTPSDNQNNQ